MSDRSGATPTAASSTADGKRCASASSAASSTRAWCLTGTTLTPRPSWVPAWDSLSDAERRAFARSQEVFAGLVTHTDAQIGRIVDALIEQGVYDNTVIMVLSDNGASAEGGPAGTFNEYALTLGGDDSIIDRVDELGTNRGYQHYPWGWAWAGNTPFKLWKRYTWLGGTRTPLVVGWPSGIRDGGAIRQQFCHAVDVMPTILDVAGVQPSDGLDGRSFRPSFDDPAATTRPTQYFEILGSRAIYHDGWKATTDHVISGVGAETELLEGSHRYEDDRWSLYDLRTDFSESHDQASREPDRLDQMIDLWTTEAERNQVLPLNQDSFLDLIRDAAANAPSRRERHTYRIGTSPVHEDMCPDLASGFVLTAEIDTDAESATGILCAQGDWNNGWAAFIDDGRLHYALSWVGRQTIVSSRHLHGRLSTVAIRYEPGDDTRPDTVMLIVNGDQVGLGELPDAVPPLWQYGGAYLTVGYDEGLPVVDSYSVPFRWTGPLNVTIDVGSAEPLGARRDVADRDRWRLTPMSDALHDDDQHVHDTAIAARRRRRRQRHRHRTRRDRTPRGARRARRTQPARGGRPGRGWPDAALLPLRLPPGPAAIRHRTDPPQRHRQVPLRRRTTNRRRSRPPQLRHGARQRAVGALDDAARTRRRHRQTASQPGEPTRCPGEGST